jgi:hypothetical protein
MKKIILFALTLICLESYGQSPLEKAVLTELNAYRARLSKTSWRPKKETKPVEIGVLCKMKFDSQLSAMSKYHATYLKKCQEQFKDLDILLGHDEDKRDLSNFIEMDFEKRGENLRKLSPNKFALGEIQFQTFSVAKGRFTESGIAKAIIEGFDRSDGHKDVMLMEYNEESEIPIVGISILTIENKDLKYLDYVIVIDFGAIAK